MNDWMKHPGLYRLFELGHVVAADGIREYMFESAGVDTTGASLVSVYSRVPSLEASVIADLDEIMGRGRFDFGDEEEDTLCRDPALAGAEIIRTSGGHHFDGDYQALARRILDGARQRSGS